MVLFPEYEEDAVKVALQVVPVLKTMAVSGMMECMR
jgi:hypothetical protein